MVELESQLSHKNKLYQLRSLINWSALEENALTHVDIKQFGEIGSHIE